MKKLTDISINVTKIIALTLIFITCLLIIFKFTFLRYTFHNILPKNEYEVNINITAQGFNQPISISTFLPLSDIRQTISDEINNSTQMEFLIEQSKAGRHGRWTTSNAEGNIAINYTFNFMGKAIQYNIDTSLVASKTYPPGFNEYLAATEYIQAEHPEIQQIFLEQVGDEKTIYSILLKIHNYTNTLIPRPFKGLTDALTAARLGEASCNGKSRLFVALVRAANIPSRLVGGIILEQGSKKTSHQWVEVYIQTEWVPFDPLNDHFGYIPHNYLSLYRGDEYLFSHTPNINFDYRFTIKSRLSPNPLLQNELKSNTLNAYQLWEMFENIGIPLGLLRIILLLPLGALIVAIFRNVIGLQTFGVFLPALIAVASRETGLMWGIMAFLIIIALVSLIHFPLEKWGILYTPKLVIMLVFVVILFLVIAYVAIELKVTALAYLALFPIVILTITAEQFARTITEEGFVPALWVTLQTLLVASTAYFVMDSNAMEALFLAFPELFLAIIGFSLLLGQWVGLRVAEYLRFRVLIK